MIFTQTREGRKGKTKLFENFLHSSDLSVREPHFYSMRMIGRIGQDIFHNAGRLFAGSLILLQNDGDLQPGTDIFSCPMRHIKTSSNSIPAFP